jgi:hypothetical protein
VLKPDENLRETTLHSQKEIVYRDSGERKKAECSKKYQEETTKREVQCVFQSSHVPEKTIHKIVIIRHE